MRQMFPGLMILSDPASADPKSRTPEAERSGFSFSIDEPVSVVSPAVFASPHSGRLYPKGFLETCTASTLDLRRIEDAYVDRLLTEAKTSATIPEQSPLQTLRALRLSCLLEILYATGLRVSELVALPLSAARRDARMIVVRGKGNKERLVPLNESSKQAMADYLAALDADCTPRVFTLKEIAVGASFVVV